MNIIHVILSKNTSAKTSRLNVGDNDVLKEFLDQRGMKLHTIHTSGHVTIDTMKKLTAELLPKLIIPFHTNHPDRYAELFPETPVADVRDGVPISI